MLNFRNWFEQDWIKNIPEDKLPKNEAGIESFVKGMSNYEENKKAVNNHLARKPVYEVLYEPQPISNNLLTIYSPHLLDAEGVMTNVRKPIYAFFVEEKRRSTYLPGNMLIRVPPCYFDESDKELLHGIIIHELRHAVDWINPNIGVKATAHYAHNVSQYAETTSEARAFAEQLQSMMERIGNPNKVIKLLESGTFGLSRELMPYAIDFLNKYGKQTTNEIFTPPAIVQTAQENMPAIVAQKIAKTINSMRFSNFVIKP